MIKVDQSSESGFLSVEKMNLIEGMDAKTKQVQNSFSVGLGHINQGVSHSSQQL